VITFIYVKVLLSGTLVKDLSATKTTWLWSLTAILDVI